MNRSKTPEQLISTLSLPGGRVFVNLPPKMIFSDGINRLLNLFSGMKAEISVISSSRLTRIDVSGLTVTYFQLTQLSQAFLNIFFSGPNRILIVEASNILGHFQVPRELGKILIVSSPFKTIDDLTETARFLSGPAAQKLQISPLNLASFLGQIGYYIVDPTLNTFVHRGTPVQLKMTFTQYQEYLLRLQRETTPGNIRKEPFSALQATNFLYPSELQAQHNLPRERRPDIIADLPIDEGGWVTSDIVRNISQYSPKLDWLIDFFRKSPGRHVIWTSFNQSNGVQIIATILRLAGFRVTDITGIDPYANRYIKLDDFNASSALAEVVLVSNLFAFGNIRNVRSLIIFEQHPTDSVLNSYLQAIASSADEILALFLISTGPNNEPTIEQTNYLTMAKRISQKDTILNILSSGQIFPQYLETYRQVFDNPNLSLADLQTVFTGKTFKPLEI